MGMRNAVSKKMSAPKRDNRYEKPPKCFYDKYIVRCDTISDKPCVSLKTSANPRKHIFYFHGGAYTLQAQKMHWSIVDHILSEIPCEITFINYPLAPEFTCADTMTMVREAYSSLSEKNGQETILMGDSAGGGLALALAQYIQREGLQPKPKKLVLFSPWLDVSMADDIPQEQAEKDLILAKETLIMVGKRYAGDHDTRDARCSPLYGDVTGIGDVALFTGTSEILHVQAVQLKNKLISKGQRLSWYEYEQMQHVWVGFPIPEAKEAMDQVIAFIDK